jgi:hypothetical protein
MIEETYCSYKVSNLLQEKGFNQECFAKYAKETCIERYYDDYRERMLSWEINPGELIIPSIDRDRYEIYGTTISAPTHQMALKWLREIHGIDIIIKITNLVGENRKYYCMIYDKNNNSYIIDLFNSYEETEEAALKACLEKLI